MLFCKIAKNDNYLRHVCQSVHIYLRSSVLPSGSMPIRLSVRMEQLGSSLRDFHELLYNIFV